MDAGFTYIKRFIPETQSNFQIAPSSNMVLLMHFDGTNGSTTFTDSTGHHLVAPSGNAQISTAQSVFGGASGTFDGTGDWVDVTASMNDFIFGTGDWTIDFRVRPNGLGTTAIIYDGRTAEPQNNVVVYKRSVDDRYAAYVNGSNVILGGTVAQLGVWNHVAVVQASGNMQMYVDGILVTPNQPFSVNLLGGALRIGSAFDGTSGWNGWIDELRVLQGLAYWTAPFSVPGNPYTVS